MSSAFGSIQLSQYDLPPSPPASDGSPRQPNYQRAMSPRTLTLRSPSNNLDQRGNSNAQQESPVLGWVQPQIVRGNSDLADRNVPSSSAGREQQSDQNPELLEQERRNQFSRHYAAQGSNRGSMDLQPVSALSPATPRYPQDYPTRSEYPPRTTSIDGAVLLASETHRRYN